MLDIRSVLKDKADDELSRRISNTLLEITEEIRGKLRDYSDLSRLEIRKKPNISAEDDLMRIGCVRLLTDHKIIFWNPESTSSAVDYEITVVNRYALEKLYAELKTPSGSHAEPIPNLVYYNPLTGNGFTNGKYISLKSSKPSSRTKPKEIFDLLYSYAPNDVPRDKLTATLRLGKASPDESDRLSEAFSNLRRRCGVDETVISLKGSGILNARTMPFEKLPDFYIFPE